MGWVEQLRAGCSQFFEADGQPCTEMVLTASPDITAGPLHDVEKLRQSPRTGADQAGGCPDGADRRDGHPCQSVLVRHRARGHDDADKLHPQRHRSGQGRRPLPAGLAVTGSVSVWGKLHHGQMDAYHKLYQAAEIRSRSAATRRTWIARRCASETRWLI